MSGASQKWRSGNQFHPHLQRDGKSEGYVYDPGQGDQVRHVQDANKKKVKSNLAAKGQKKAKGMSVSSNMDTESKMSDVPNKKKAKSDQATKGCKKVKGTSMAVAADE